MKIVKLKIINSRKSLLIHWDDKRKTRFHSIWLRYNSYDYKTRSKQNGQRLITLNDIDQNILIENAVFDICGECNNPLYSEYYLYDIGYWNQYSFSGLLFGCTDQSALNYDMNAIINNDSCMYE